MKPVVHSFGLVVVLLAALMLPAAVIGFYRDGVAAGQSFLLAAMITLFIGGCLISSTARSSRSLNKRQCYAMLFLFWLGLPPLAALPFWIGPWAFPYLDALFEAVSGLTTTGFTVLDGRTEVASAILFWRALLQWAGGLMTVVLLVTVLVSLHVGGLQLFRSALPYGEGGGSITDRLRATVLNLLPVYSGLTAICAFALWLAGAGAFDALCLALSAISTGGFVTAGGQEVLLRSPVQIVLLVFMCIGAINLTTLWAVATRRPRALERDPEARYLLLAIVLLGLVVGISTAVHTGEAPLRIVLEAAFQVVSALTTTGFVIPDADTWALVSPVLIIGLLLTGGCTASPSGGMRLMRIAVLFKQARRELYRLNHPHGVLPLRYGQQRVDDQAIWGVWSYFFALVGFIALIAIVLSGLGLEPMAAIAASVACLTNTGPFASVLAPELGPISQVPAGVREVFMTAMLLARLELLALLILLSPAYWQR